MLGANILIENLPEKVSNKTLREDIGKLVKSHKGTKMFSTEFGDTYCIPSFGGLVVFIPYLMNITFVGNGVLNKKENTNKINAVVSLLPHMENVLYKELYNKFVKFSDRYK